MVERTSKFLLIVAVSVCFMLILYQYVGPGLSLGSPSGRSYSEELDLFPTPDPHYVKKYYFPVRELERELAFDMKGEDVIVFLHIQKTGGTTFGRHLVQNVRLEVPCDCRPGQKKCTCYRPNRRETWLFSRFSTGWSCGLHADWTELTSCVPAAMERRGCAGNRTLRSVPAAGRGEGAGGARPGRGPPHACSEVSPWGLISTRSECDPTLPGAVGTLPLERVPLSGSLAEIVRCCRH
uniref:Heparan-sulfate 6-O-sulfotransferase n=1 Tax=Athene cunicularia TaxID=194338 RepID=A0A663MMJ8_ATHCN